METKNIFINIVKIIFIIFAVIFIIQMFLKLIGKTPADIQIIYITNGVIISYLLVMSYNVGKFMGRVDEFINNTKDSFKRIKEDITELKNK